MQSPRFLWNCSCVSVYSSGPGNRPCWCCERQTICWLHSMYPSFTLPSPPLPPHYWCYKLTPYIEGTSISSVSSKITCRFSIPYALGLWNIYSQGQLNGLVSQAQILLRIWARTNPKNFWNICMPSIPRIRDFAHRYTLKHCSVFAFFTPPTRRSHIIG